MQSCCFIGHKNCPLEIENKLLFAIEKLIIKEQVRTFYVGTHGDFDRITYKVLEKLEKKHNIQIFVVLAYLRKENYPYYNIKKTIFPDVLTKTPLKFAIRKRNSFMIDHSKFVVSYLENSLSNTYTFVEEALKKKKQIINLGTYDISQIIF